MDIERDIFSVRDWLDLVGELEKRAESVPDCDGHGGTKAELELLACGPLKQVTTSLLLTLLESRRLLWEILEICSWN